MYTTNFVLIILLSDSVCELVYRGFTAFPLPSTKNIHHQQQKGTASNECMCFNMLQDGKTKG